MIRPQTLLRKIDYIEYYTWAIPNYYSWAYGSTTGLSNDHIEYNPTTDGWECTAPPCLARPDDQSTTYYMLKFWQTEFNPGLS